MKPSTYVHRITGRVFKVLPLYETSLKGEDMCVNEYINSLVGELLGSCKTFPCLADSADYYAVINTLQNMADDLGTIDECRREVMKMCNLLNHLEETVG